MTSQKRCSLSRISSSTRPRGVERLPKATLEGAARRLAQRAAWLPPVRRTTLWAHRSGPPSPPLLTPTSAGRFLCGDEPAELCGRRIVGYERKGVPGA